MKKQNKIYWIVGAIIVIVLAVFVSLNEKEKIDEKVKIGILTPLTGDMNSWGQATSKGVELALRDSKMDNIELIYEDSKCDVSTGVTATNKLIGVDGASVIFGTNCSGVTLSIASIVEQKEVVQMAIGSSDPAITNAGDYTFRMWPSDDYEALVIGNYMVNSGYSNFGILYMNNDYGVSFKNALKKVYQDNGKEIVVEEPFEQNGSDFKTQLIKIKKANPDALFVVTNPSEATVIFKQISELKIETQLFSSGWLIEDPQILTGSSDFIEGVIYANMELSTDLKDKMIENYGDEGENLAVSSLSYDGMMLILNSIKKCGGNSSCIKDELYKVKGYEGVSGITSFDKNGDPVDRNFIIKTIKNRVPSVLEN